MATINLLSFLFSVALSLNAKRIYPKYVNMKTVPKIIVGLGLFYIPLSIVHLAYISPQMKKMEM